MEDKEENVRLNADIPLELKRRVKLYCAKEDLDMRLFVIMALEQLLDELEGVKT